MCWLLTDIYLNSLTISERKYLLWLGKLGLSLKYAQVLKLNSYLYIYVSPSRFLGSPAVSLKLTFSTGDPFRHTAFLRLSLRSTGRKRCRPTDGGRTRGLCRLPPTALAALFETTCFVFLHARAPWTPFTQLTSR